MWGYTPYFIDVNPAPLFLGKSGAGLRPKRPFELTVHAYPDPTLPGRLVYEAIHQSEDTRIVSAHRSLENLRSFVHGVKITAGMLGYDIPEPTIPTTSTSPATDTTHASY